MNNYFTYLLILVVACALAAEVSGTLGIIPSSGEIQFNPVYRECGGIVPINHLDAVSIQYKVGVKYNKDEFCVWTMYPHQNITSVLLNIESHGFQQGRDGLVVYNWFSNRTIESQFIFHEAKTVLIPGSYLFLAFSSSNFAGNGTGFNVTINGQGAAGPWGHPAFFLPQPAGDFSYPQVVNQTSYSNDARVSIVVQGQTSGITSTKRFLLQDLGTESNADFVDIFTLHPYEYFPRGAPLFANIGAFSGAFNGTLWRATSISPFPHVYGFTSNSANVSTGFSIRWENYP